MKRSLLLLSLISHALLLPSESADGAGPGTGGRTIRLDDEPAGPYLLRVVTSPDPPRVESLFVEVRVLEASTNAIVRNAIVLASAVPTEGAAAPIEALATHDFAPIPGEYAAHLPVSAPGFWEIYIRVEGAQGQGEVSFLQRVAGQSSLGAALSILLPLVGLAALGAAFLWLQRTRGNPAVLENRLAVDD